MQRLLYRDLCVDRILIAVQVFDDEADHVSTLGSIELFPCPWLCAEGECFTVLRNDLRSA